MAMTPLLSLYLNLEHLMLVAERVNEDTADGIRDVMDPIWYQLSDQDRETLNQRAVGFIRSFEGLSIPLGDHIYYRDPGPPKKASIPREPIQGWRKAA
jgi:hypothetical protein